MTSTNQTTVPKEHVRRTRDYEWVCATCKQEKREHRLHRPPRHLEWAEIGEAFHVYMFETGGELIVTCNRHGTPIFRVPLPAVEFDVVARVAMR
jgi:hypothetical protein